MISARKLRHAAALVAFAAFVSSASIADAANFAGTWAFSGSNGAGGMVAPVCVFRQNASKIGGSCKGPNGIGSAAGLVNGRAIVLQWHVIATTSRGTSGIVTFKGVWGSDGDIRGTWLHSAAPAVIGPFTAQKL
jgi:hypothetical protein